MQLNPHRLAALGPDESSAPGPPVGERRPGRHNVPEAAAHVAYDSDSISDRRGACEPLVRLGIDGGGGLGVAHHAASAGQACRNAAQRLGPASPAARLASGDGAARRPGPGDRPSRGIRCAANAERPSDCGPPHAAQMVAPPRGTHGSRRKTPAPTETGSVRSFGIPARARWLATRQRLGHTRALRRKRREGRPAQAAEPYRTAAAPRIGCSGTPSRRKVSGGSSRQA